MCINVCWFCSVQSEDEAGPLDVLKSQICDNVTLYAQKYDEEFHVSVVKCGRQ